ncbi:aminotransferase class I/II-fold pyridoxal phosphate-dependent enzyme [Candidatus Protochlamydia phocaeensis]|uniref:aminotransferase class I/II-fold pyridoxal phosphate-dependent enzyme n=1 Tax=Candidatus Protochlamydia phocaeensis TaxID=1414722 RepID=UPI000838A405|nr:aminotransferase class I/II-fold pyridoxal phosphate-dependent enzyme [Candidatus Protochlamydia phocaeensis]
MQRSPIVLFLLSLLLGPFLYSTEAEKKAEQNKKDVIFLQPNTTQLFTELYQAYGLLHPPSRTFFEDALYLDQSTPTTILPLQFSNQVIFDHASAVLSQFHKRVNDLELYIDPHKQKPVFYTAAGSKHLIVALVYAIAMSEPNKKFVFVEQSPFYSGHPNAVTGIFNYPNARFLAFHTPSDIRVEPDEILVEFVTSPNNPDGKFRQPLTDAKIILADFVFASSSFGNEGTGYLEKNIEWIRQARLDGKHVFSFNSASKQFGKTGTRCGYIWYPMEDPYAASIFSKFFGFISASTVAGGASGLAEFLDLIQAFLDLPDTGKALRQDSHKSLVSRHALVEKELLKKYPGSEILSIPGSPTLFAKIKDARIPSKRASDVLLEDLNVYVNSGDTMGETNEFVRLNLSGYSQILVEFLNRLAEAKQYSIQDVLFTSADNCSHRIISDALYFANPGDCLLEVDASREPVEVIFPPFMDYAASKEIKIKKIDASENPVMVKSESFSEVLKNSKDSLTVQWTQPINVKGTWKIIDRKKLERSKE